MAKKTQEEIERSQRSFVTLQKAFEEAKKRNPKLSFSQFNAARVLSKIQRGEATAQLGPKLLREGEWWEAGRSSFEMYRSKFSIAPNSRVIDYGCGTLRIGGHFIRYLDPNCYFGLELLQEFTEIGRNLIGEALVREKSPRFGVINNEADIEAAVAFDADFVYSSSVCTHVHPDEAAVYFRNLSILAHKPGAFLFFDAAISDEPLRYRNLSWSLDRYKRALRNFEFVRIHSPVPTEEEGKQITLGTLLFKRKQEENSARSPSRGSRKGKKS
jgi:SAM-dependent methyltransferase